MRKTVVVVALFALTLIAGCKNQTSRVDKSKIDDLAEKTMLAIASDKPETIYSEDFSDWYKQSLSEKEWVEIAKAYTLRLGTMEKFFRTKLDLTVINDVHEAIAKYSVTWSKAPGTLEISMSKEPDEPWKIGKIIIRSEAIGENNGVPAIKKLENQAEKVIKSADVKLPTGDDSSIKNLPAATQ